MLKEKKKEKRISDESNQESSSVRLTENNSRNVKG